MNGGWINFLKKAWNNKELLTPEKSKQVGYYLKTYIFCYGLIVFTFYVIPFSLVILINLCVIIHVVFFAYGFQKRLIIPEKVSDSRVKKDLKFLCVFTVIILLIINLLLFL